VSGDTTGLEVIGDLVARVVTSTSKQHTRGLILTSPNSTRYRVTVNDDGSLSTTVV